MSNFDTKPRKLGGRPKLLTPSERSEIAVLYFDLQWTAREIQEKKHPSLGISTIRMIAAQERRSPSQKEPGSE